jgi:type III pantothenate kinase
LAEPALWTLAGPNPEARDHLAGWLRQFQHHVRIIDDAGQLQLKVLVDVPNYVGIDRLLNAIAVLDRTPRGQPIVVVCAGSAVTVDFVDAEGAFRGGAILPGFRIMAQSLKDHTARLPLVEGFAENIPLPPTNTIAAMKSGISNAIHGGVERMVRRLGELHGKPHVFIAGGDADLLADLDLEAEIVGPFLTLDGLRLAAKSLK